MATAAVQAFAITVAIGATAIGEVLDVPEITFKKDFIDVTNMDSTGGYEESIVNKIIRSDELVVVCNSVVGNAGQIAVKAQQVLGTAATITFTFPDGTVIAGAALVTKYSYIGTDKEKQITFSMTLKWTGAVTDTTTYATAPSDLSITTATLYPAFAPGTYAYTAVSTADTGTFTLTFLTATAKLYRAGVLVQSLVTATPSGSVSFGADLALTQFTIVVTEALKGTRTYVINVANAAA